MTASDSDGDRDGGQGRLSFCPLPALSPSFRIPSRASTPLTPQVGGRGSDRCGNSSLPTWNGEQVHCLPEKREPPHEALQSLLAATLTTSPGSFALTSHRMLSKMHRATPALTEGHNPLPGCAPRSHPVHRLQRAWLGGPMPPCEGPGSSPLNPLPSTAYVSSPNGEVRREITLANEVGLCQNNYRLSIHNTIIY